MAAKSTARAATIVGVGESNFRELYSLKGVPQDDHALAAAALRTALDDAGLAKSDIDGLLVARLDYNRFADVIGVRNPSIVNGYEGTGRMSGVILQHAAALIESGQAEVVACVYGNNGRSVKMKYGGEGGGSTTAYDAMYGMTSPGAYVAMMYRRYQQIYGAPDDALAPIAISNRAHAALNPVAVMTEPIDEAEYLASRYIAEPLRLYDYCIINDGGIAIIVTSADRARDLPKRGVRIAGSAVSSDLTNFYTSFDFFAGASESVASRVHDFAGTTNADVDCVQVYDNFTPVALFALEAFGYCDAGKGWQWLRDNSIAFDGDLPMNTSGGHTAESYMQGWALLVEAVRQIRGEAGARQVADCDVAQYICASPIVSSHVLIGA